MPKSRGWVRSGETSMVCRGAEGRPPRRWTFRLNGGQGGSRTCCLQDPQISRPELTAVGCSQPGSSPGRLCQAGLSPHGSVFRTGQVGIPAGGREGKPRTLLPDLAGESTGTTSRAGGEPLGGPSTNPRPHGTDCVGGRCLSHVQSRPELRQNYKKTRTLFSRQVTMTNRNKSHTP